MRSKEYGMFDESQGGVWKHDENLERIKRTSRTLLVASQARSTLGDRHFVLLDLASSPKSDPWFS